MRLTDGSELDDSDIRKLRSSAPNVVMCKTCPTARRIRQGCGRHRQDFAYFGVEGSLLDLKANASFTVVDTIVNRPP